MLPLLLLAGLVAQTPATFRAGVSLVYVDAAVTHNGQPVEELSQADFAVTDNGEPCQIVYFGFREEPLDLILLFDTSASMEPVVERAAASARAALGELRSGDRVAVMAFSRGSDLLLDFTDDRDTVERTLARVLQRPFLRTTQLQKAIDDAAQHFLKQPRTNRRRAILAITDGNGNGRAAKAVENVWNADAVVSGLIVRSVGMTVLFRVVRPDSLFVGGMGGISENTGGEAAKFDDAGVGLREMIRRLRLRYTIGYEMPAARPGARREIRVRLSADAARRYPDATVRARRAMSCPTFVST